MIGLGNPGGKYEKNRHNVGKMFVGGLGDVRGVRAVETNCFMNESGRFVKKHLTNLSDPPAGEAGLTNLYIAHDDLDLKLGEFKINFGKGPELHNGILSIEEAMGTRDFWRVRIGVDNRGSGQARMTGENYVLSDFTKEEREVLDNLFPKIYEELEKRS